MSTPNTPEPSYEASALRIELIVWHHKRRRAKLPFAATAYLIDGNSTRKTPFDILDAGHCEQASTEGEAARDALRDLQERRERIAGANDAILAHALLDPLGSITERR